MKKVHRETINGKAIVAPAKEYSTGLVGGERSHNRPRHNLKQRNHDRLFHAEAANEGDHPVSKIKNVSQLAKCSSPLAKGSVTARQRLMKNAQYNPNHENSSSSNKMLVENREWSSTNSCSKKKLIGKKMSKPTQISNMEAQNNQYKGSSSNRLSAIKSPTLLRDRKDSKKLKSLSSSYLFDTESKNNSRNKPHVLACQKKPLHLTTKQKVQKTLRQTQQYQLSNSKSERVLRYIQKMREEEQEQHQHSKRLYLQKLERFRQTASEYLPHVYSYSQMEPGRMVPSDIIIDRDDQNFHQASSINEGPPSRILRHGMEILEYYLEAEDLQASQQSELCNRTCLSIMSKGSRAD